MRPHGFVTIVVLLMIFSSCDPAVIETLKISNRTEQPITIVIEKSKDRHWTEYDQGATYLSFYANSVTNIGDSLFITEYSIQPGKEFFIYNYFGIGIHSSFNLPEKAAIRLQELVDTLYLRNHSLTKNIYDMENWEVEFERYRTGGGESVYTFVIERRDWE